MFRLSFALTIGARLFIFRDDVEKEIQAEV